MTSEWYLARAGQRLGPYTPLQLRQMVADGELRPNDMVTSAALGRWVSARQIKGLFHPEAAPPVVRTPTTSAPNSTNKEVLSLDDCDTARSAARPPRSSSKSQQIPEQRLQASQERPDPNNSVSYDQVSWYRQSHIVSRFVLVGLVFPPFIWAVCIICLTGGIFYDHRRKDGSLARWGNANKGVALLILVTQLAVYYQAISKWTESDKQGSSGEGSASSPGKSFAKPNETLSLPRYSKSTAATEVHNGVTVPYRLWVVPGKWQKLTIPKGNAIDLSLGNRDGTCEVAVVAERVQVPLDALRKGAVQNLSNEDPRCQVVNEERRLVNGVTVVCLTIEFISDGIPMTLLGYYFSNSKGTVQLAAITARNLFVEMKTDLEEALNGFEAP